MISGYTALRIPGIRIDARIEAERVLRLLEAAFFNIAIKWKMETVNFVIISDARVGDSRMGIRIW